MFYSQDALFHEIVQPWIELNRNLSQPDIVQPESSTLITLAKYLAVVISHYPERFNSTGNPKKKPIDDIITDFADTVKHGILTKSFRTCSIHVESVIEVQRINNIEKYRFLRNIIYIENKRFGSVDFILYTLPFIKNLSGSMSHILYELYKTDALQVICSCNPFSKETNLYYSPQKSRNVNQSKIRFVKKNQSNEFIPTDVLAWPINFIQKSIQSLYYTAGTDFYNHSN